MVAPTSRLSPSGRLLSGGSGGGGAPLSFVRYVDQGTAVPLAEQTGSESAPYASLAQAVTDLDSGDGGVVYVTPGDYSADAVVTNSSIYFVGLGPFIGTNVQTIMPSITCNGPELGLASVQQGGGKSIAAAGALLELREADLGSNVVNAGSIVATGSDDLPSIGGVVTANSISALDCTLFAATVSVGLTAKGCFLAGGTIALGNATADFRSTDFVGVTLTFGGGSDVTLDLYSYSSALDDAVSLPLSTVVIGPGLLVSNIDQDSSVSPIDQVLLPANHAPGLYAVSGACAVTSAGAHTLTPTVVGVGDGGAFDIGNDAAWSAIDTSAPKTVGLAPCVVYSDGTAPLVLRWTLDSTGGDTAVFTLRAGALPHAS